MKDTIIIGTKHGPIMVSKWLMNLWQRYGWPTETTLEKMAQNYAKYKLPDGIEGDQWIHGGRSRSSSSE